MPHFDADRNTATRFLLALAGIIAFVAIGVGIRDFFQKKTGSAPSASTPSVVQPEDAKSLRKKTTSAKTRRVRMSKTEANAPESAQAVAEATEKPLVSEETSGTGVKPIGVTYDLNTSQPAHDVVEAAMRTSRVGNKFGTIADCVPLPNVTKPRDVDANYYQNWAREYSCQF